MKEKRLPRFIKNRALFAFLQSKVGRVLSNWFFQGMLYMQGVEVVYKIFLDVVLILGIRKIFAAVNGGGDWLVPCLLGHTVNWLINGQPVAMRRHLDWGKNNDACFLSYIISLQERIAQRRYLGGAAAFGSLSRGKYRPTSDLDIRFLLSGGWANRVRIANYCFVERVRAAVYRFPLDLYAFDLATLQQKMNKEEIPVIYYDPGGLLEDAYRETVPFSVFVGQFKNNVLGKGKEGDER